MDVFAEMYGMVAGGMVHEREYCMHVIPRLACVYVHR